MRCASLTQVKVGLTLARSWGPSSLRRLSPASPDPQVFKSARDFAAWLGVVPRQNSTGGKTKLGPIAKKGDCCLRRLLVLGGRSALRVAGRHKGALRDWLASLLEKKKSARLASVALANKLARII